MKKYILALVLSMSLISITSAHASIKNNFFFGVDLNRSDVRHQYAQPAVGTDPLSNEADKTKKDNGRYSLGLNAGFKSTINNTYFISPEFFYDRLGSKSYDFYHSDAAYPAPYDRLKIKDRYGIRLNLGYNLSHLVSAKNYSGFMANQLSKLSVFVNGGLARISYEADLPSIGDRKDNLFEISPIVGFGFNYAVTKNWSAKLAYDIQEVSVRYMDEGLSDDIKIETYRLGAVYNF